MGLFLVYVLLVEPQNLIPTTHQALNKSIQYETVVVYFIFDIAKLGARRGPLPQPYLGQPTNDFSYFVGFYIFSFFLDLF